MVSLPLVHGGWVSINPQEVAGIREIQAAGMVMDGKCAVSLRGGVTYEIHYAAHTVRQKLGL